MNKRSLLIFPALVLGLLAPKAQADTFLQYLAPSTATSITFDGTTLTGTAIPVELSYLDPVSGAPATGTLNFTATALAGEATEAFGFFFVVPVDDITFTLTNGSTNIISGTAALGNLDGTDAGLSLSANSTDGIVFTSDLYGPRTGLSFQLNTGDPAPDLSVAAGTLSSFTATATPGSFVGTAAVTPEPSALTLLGTGMLGLLGVARRKLAA